MADTFSIANMVKDLRLALELPAAHAAALALAQAAFDLFRDAQSHGWGARDIGHLSAALDEVAQTGRNASRSLRSIPRDG